MAFVLTQKESEKVTPNRKNPRPDYYSADLGVNFEISEDFETVLLLLPQSAKQQLSQAISQKDASTDSRISKRDGVLASFLEVDQKNCFDAYNELNDSLNQTTQVLAALSDPRFREVPEVAELSEDLQYKEKETFTRRARIYQDFVVAKLAMDRLNGDYKPEQKREAQLSSWRSVLQDYLF